MDKVRHSVGTFATGIFYVETSRGFPLRGNGWYFDSVAKEAIELDLIEYSENQVKASFRLDKRHFRSFVQDVFKYFCSPKQAVVAFIGLLEKVTSIIVTAISQIT